LSQGRRSIGKRFDGAFVDLADSVGHLIRRGDKSAPVFDKLVSLEICEPNHEPEHEVAKLISQFLVVYWANGWNALHQRDPFQRCFPEFIDNSLRCFYDVIPFADKAIEDQAKDIAGAIGHNGAAKRTDLTQWLIARTAKPLQKQLGIFFTPPALADFVVAQTDKALLDVAPSPLDICDRIMNSAAANDNNSSQAQRDMMLLDPAVGSGEFVLAVFRRVVSVAKQRNISGEAQRKLLRAVIAQTTGFEIHPVALLSACFRIVEFLHQHEISPDSCQPIRLHWNSAFSMLHDQDFGSKKPIVVVIGNPPFGTLNKSTDATISALLRGEYRDANKRVHSDQPSYFIDENGPINERKTWLYDLYVQFFRLAQFLVDQSGHGVIGFVSNRGFVDNITFRGMRYQLSRSFSVIKITDLGGDVRSANQPHDENPFAIETPVAVTILAKTNCMHTSISYQRLQGSASLKLEKISTGDFFDPCTIVSHQSMPSGAAFSRQTISGSSTRINGMRLDEVMPYKGSPIITARDSLVIGFDLDELTGNLRQFCDRSISEDQIRQTFFGRSRSKRHLPGDTRTWNLKEIRSTFSESHLTDRIRDCHYRPFDVRKIVWFEELLDWPRTDLMNCLCESGNFGIVSRRQSPPHVNWNYAWTTTGLTVDGIIRSDNRGNESIFPVWKNGQLNFNRKFIDMLIRTWGVTVRPDQNPITGDRILGGREIAGYIYGLLQCGTYRKKLQEELCTNYPPVLILNRWENACEVIAIGKKLLCLHQSPLARSPTSQPSSNKPQSKSFGNTSIAGDGNPNDLSKSYGKKLQGHLVYSASTIKFGDVVVAINIAEILWEYRIGTHQVLRKWLLDRRGTTYCKYSACCFGDIVRRIRRTIDLSNRLDQCIDSAGQWPQAFVSST
jgi:predicted helicase